jgi:hypothetical protein
VAEDGERLTLFEWESAETLRAGQTHPERLAVKALGRQTFYEDPCEAGGGLTPGKRGLAPRQPAVSGLAADARRAEGDPGRGNKKREIRMCPRKAAWAAEVRGCTLDPRFRGGDTLRSRRSWHGRG